MNSTDEVWKDLPEYEGVYKVSNLGNVKSVDRKIEYSDGKIVRYKGQILKPVKGTGGYLYAGLNYKGSKKLKLIHGLVARTFYDHEPNRLIVVNHIDLDKTNNKLSNLEIVPQRVNANHKHLKSKSKYTGVSIKNGLYTAQIWIDRGLRFLGKFESELEAHLAYEKALKNKHLFTTTAEDFRLRLRKL